MSEMTDDSRREMTADEKKHEAFAQDVTRRAEHALLGRQAVDVLVVAAVSTDEDAVGRVAAGLYDKISETQQPTEDIVGNELRIVEMAAQLAHEVHDQAHDETVQLLRSRIAELEMFLGEDRLRLKAELEAERRKNAANTSKVEDQAFTISLLREDKDAKDLQLFQMGQRLQGYEATASPVEPDLAEKSPHRRPHLGIKAVADLFRPVSV